MASVLGDNVWVSGKFLDKGTRREDVDPELVGSVGSHLWVDEGQRANVNAAGEAVTGLRDNVYVDGVLYEKGSTPSDPQVVAKIGDHMWVDGRPPVGVKPTSVDDAPDEVPVPELAPEGLAVATVESEVSVTDPEPSDTPSPPPQGGPKGSAKAWHEYAAAVGVDVPEDAKRDDVIDAVKAAGKPVE